MQSECCRRGHYSRAAVCEVEMVEVGDGRLEEEVELTQATGVSRA